MCGCKRKKEKVCEYKRERQSVCGGGVTLFPPSAAAADHRGTCEARKG